MKHSLTVLLVLLLASIASVPEAIAQETDTTAVPRDETGQDEVRGVALEQNYPNPFNYETRIPFVLGEDMFEDGRPVVVSVRIYNVLRQPIAVPTAFDHPSAAGQPALELRYDMPGRYELYWDGRDRGGQPVPSGIYFCHVTANRSQNVLKMIVAR
jgi:hypothetical protein